MKWAGRPEVEVPDEGAPPVIPEVGVGDPHEPEDGVHGGKGLLLQEGPVEGRLGEEVVVLLVVFVEVAEKDPGHPPGPGQFPEIVLIGRGVHHPGFGPLGHHQGVAVGIAPAFASGNEGDGAEADGPGRGGPGERCRRIHDIMPTIISSWSQMKIAGVGGAGVPIELFSAAWNVRPSRS